MALLDSGIFNEPISDRVHRATVADLVQHLLQNPNILQAPVQPSSPDAESVVASDQSQTNNNSQNGAQATPPQSTLQRFGDWLNERDTGAQPAAPLALAPQPAQQPQPTPDIPSTAAMISNAQPVGDASAMSRDALATPASPYNPSWSDTSTQANPQAGQPAPMSLAPAPQDQAPAPAQAAPQTASAQSPQYRPVEPLDRLSAFVHGVGSGGLFGGLIDAAHGIDRASQDQNQTYQLLISKGVPEATAKAAISNSTIMTQILPQVFPQKAPAIEKLAPGESLVQTSYAPDGQLQTRDITPGGGAPSDKTQAGRQQIAAQYGLKPGTMEHTAYVLNGKVPDVTPDRAQIAAADDQVRQSGHLIEDLQRAKVLAQRAYSGVGASERARVVNNIPFVDHPDANATTEYDNLIQSSILPSLKSTFPGRVTNADLKLMQDLQGSSSYTAPVRDAIIDRGIKRAQELQAEKQAQAKSLREGTYYKPGGGPDAEANAQAAPAIQMPQVGEVQQGYRYSGGDPADRNSWQAVQ